MMSTQSEKVLSATSVGDATNHRRKSENIFPIPKRLSSKSDLDVRPQTAVLEELDGLANLVEGIKKEIASYSNIEREYMQQLENGLTKDEKKGLDENTRLQRTISQIRRLRIYKKEAMDELAAANMKIAQLECRIERISNEEAEAELNVRLYELQMLYCGTEESLKINYPSKRQERLGFARPVLDKMSPPDKSEVPKEAAESKKISRKVTKVKQGHKSSAESDKNIQAKDLVNADSVIEKQLKENVAAPQIDEVSDHDISGDKPQDIISLISTSDPSSVDAELTGDTGSELDPNNNVLNNDDGISNDIRSIMTSVEEQSEPLPMPDLDIDESIEGTGKKKHWNFLSLIKKEMK